MTITLANGGTSLSLPVDMQWIDEFDWTAVQETRGYSIAGALLSDRRLKLAGRPITLQASVDYAWSTRSVATTLLAWAQTLNPPLVLTLRGVDYDVSFDYSRPIQVTPVVDYADPLPTDDCFFTLRLLTR